MAPGDRRRRSRSQCPANASEVEAPPPISIAAPASLSEGPAPAGPNEAGSSGINCYTLYIIKFDSFIWIILMIYLLLFQVSPHRWWDEGEVHRRTSFWSIGDASTWDSISGSRYWPATPDLLEDGMTHDRLSWASYAAVMPPWRSSIGVMFYQLKERFSTLTYR